MSKRCFSSIKLKVNECLYELTREISHVKALFVPVVRDAVGGSAMGKGKWSIVCQGVKSPHPPPTTHLHADLGARLENTACIIRLTTRWITSVHTDMSNEVSRGYLYLVNVTVELRHQYVRSSGTGHESSGPFKRFNG
ncbi:hypothetical protein J6590_025449 [Homalodisca vitripennis]|nr:hypothetical protein J6590_025449 [Homalodisca vitripennis]